MKKTLTTIIAMSPLVAVAAVPHSFTAGTPAKATEVNENFTSLDTAITANKTAIDEGKAAATELVNKVTAQETSLTELNTAVEAGKSAITELENKVATHETKLTQISEQLQISTDGVLVGAGQYTQFDVDCTDNHKALIETFQNNLHLSNFAFSITGSCYGDLNVLPDGETLSGFANGVVINIGTKGHAEDNTLPKAKIIPNPQTGKVNLKLGNNSSLYLARVDIEAGDNDTAIVSGGSNYVGVHHSSITGKGGNQVAISLANSNTTVHNTQITGVKQGFFAKKNSTLNIFDTSISSSNQGISISENSFLTLNRATFSGDGSAAAISVNSNSSAYVSNTSLANIKQGVTLQDNSMLSLNGVTISGNGSGDGVKLIRSTAKIANTEINGVITGIYAENSTLKTEGAEPIQIGNLDHDSLTSAITLHQSTFKHLAPLAINANDNLTVISLLASSWMTGGEKGTVELTNSTNNIYLSRSTTALYTPNNGVSSSQFECAGISQLHLNSWQKINDQNVVDTSTNCLDGNAWATAMKNALGL